VRAVAVIVAVLYALAYTVPTVLLLEGRYGSVGSFKLGSSGTLPPGTNVNTVGSVLPGSPAARAGVVAGDVVVRAAAESAPAFEQLYDRAAAGTPTEYVVIHDGARRIVTMTPQSVRPAPGAAALYLALLIRGIAIVLIGGLLLLLRPNVMTAAFFVLCLEFGELGHPNSNLELLAAAPLFWKPLLLLLTCIVNGAGPAVAAIFCMRFPSGQPLPAWRSVERAMVLAAVVTIGVYLGALVAGGTYTQLGSMLYRVESVAAWLCYAVAAAAFMVRYAGASGEDKDRLRWVAIGLGSFLVSYALFWASENMATAPADLSLWAQFINVLPLTVLYAVVRHRVLDVRVAGGRAIAYAIVSAIPVIGFSLIDWALGNTLQQSKFALVVEVLVAVGFGFWVNASQRRIDNVIESVFFHGRRIAEERLRRVARRIPHATDPAAVDDALVGEPFEALQLTSAALFRCVEGDYAHVAERGASGAPASIGPNDALALELVESRAPVQISALGSPSAVTNGAAAYSWAFPILVRQEVMGMLLLGEKRDRERLDALERDAVQALIAASAATYDHLDAVEQRRLAGELRGALDELSRENDALRAQLAREGSRA
jgi:hypothetical protein